MIIDLDESTKKVLMFIRDNAPISRLEIAEKLNLTKPTSSRVIERLITNGLVVEEGYGTSTGGRRPILLSFNPNCFYSIGISLGRSEIKVALINLNGEILKLKRSLSKRDQEADLIFDFIKSAFFEIMSEVKIDSSRILGIGVGLPGPVKNKNGLVSTPTFFSGKPTPIAKRLNEFIDVPVIVEKNANAATLAEKWFGQGREKDNFIYVMASVGVGCGLIINKQLYTGIDGEAGGLGHTTINVFGDKCSCGNFGCVETFVSITKIVENIKDKYKLNKTQEMKYYVATNPDDIIFADVINAYKKGSSIARQELEEAGEYLGVAIANVVSFFSPELIVMGGVIGSIDIVRESVKESLFARVIGSKGKVVPIVSSNLDEGVVLGAAALVIDDAFTIFS